jgi:phosphate transport system substrate-binding protein
LITGAGSSSPQRLYSRWFEAFHVLRPDVQFDYRSVGSGAGVKQLLEGMVAFSGVDAPLSDEQLGFAKLPLLHIPSTISAVVFVYNLPGVPELRLTPRILAGIFTGKITAWNDPLIAASNSNANLPAVPIVVIHRTDACSTTRVFTNYLSKVSSEWQQRVGEGSSVRWPLGLGTNGNEGVFGLVKQYGGAIAYLDFPYASENHLAFARVQNRSGRFVKADAPSLTAAAASSAIPEDFRVSITNAPGSDAYPVASLMWFVVPAPDPADTTVREVAAFLRWTTEKNPQAAAANFGFAALPEKLLERVDRALQAIH